MNELNKLPYAEWLEQSLKNIIGKSVQAICIITKFENGDTGTGYYDCSVADKILFAGFLQHDAMIDALQANGYIDSDEETQTFEEDEEDPEYG